MTKKFSFEDLQPHVDMLCDALENRGSSSSGIHYNKEVYRYAEKYRELLATIREKKVSKDTLTGTLQEYKYSVLSAASVNQSYRIQNLVNALEIYMLKEYIKVNGEVPERPKGAVC